METFLTFWSGVGTVTGANFMLRHAGAVHLIDCGLVQGRMFCDFANYEPFPYNPANISSLFVTHAHIDHIGKIPKIIREGFRGVIYSTLQTRRLAPVMLEDSMRVLATEAHSCGKEPLYEKNDIERALSLWKGLSYHEALELPGDMSTVFKDAGHILGSAMIEFTTKKGTIVFTGDLGNSPSPLFRETETIHDATYVVMESVYGDRDHEPHDIRRTKLKDEVLRVIEKRGTLVIPAFSLERTQVILFELSGLIERGEIPLVPVFVDSPLASKVTDIYESATGEFNALLRERVKHHKHLFHFPKLTFSVSTEESTAIRTVPNPKIILAGSGMSAGGRVLSHERRVLPHPENTVLLVGYQSPGGIGRQLKDGAREIFITGEKIPVRARIASIEGYSSHMDGSHLVRFVEHTAPTLKKVFVAMGEPHASLHLIQRLRDTLGVDALYPERGREYPLEL